MTEKYCPTCELVHRESVKICCVCERELVEKLESTNGKDKSCPFCVDQIEMA